MYVICTLDAMYHFIVSGTVCLESYRCMNVGNHPFS